MAEPTTAQKAALYDELVHALELAVGCLGAVQKHYQVDAKASVKFTPPYERLGTATLGEVADITNAVLGKVNDLK